MFWVIDIMMVIFVKGECECETCSNDGMGVNGYHYSESVYISPTSSSYFIVIYELSISSHPTLMHRDVKSTRQTPSTNLPLRPGLPRPSQIPRDSPW